jgi:hypothetical protein
MSSLQNKQTNEYVQMAVILFLLKRNLQTHGFAVKISYDRVGCFFKITTDEFYIWVKILNNQTLIIKNIFVMDQGQGFGPLAINQIIKTSEKCKFKKIIAENITPGKHSFWAKFNFLESDLNSRNMELNL